MADYHRPRRAAELLEISEWKLKQWMRSGRVAVAKVDGCVWVDVDSARALIEANATRPLMASLAASRTTQRQGDLERALAYLASPVVAAPPKTKRRA